jgi:hypothetical protein
MGSDELIVSGQRQGTKHQVVCTMTVSDQHWCSPCSGLHSRYWCPGNKTGGGQAGRQVVEAGNSRTPTIMEKFSAPDVTLHSGHTQSPLVQRAVRCTCRFPLHATWHSAPAPLCGAIPLAAAAVSLPRTLP